MAMIKCEECGKDISDKAVACIHCGAVLDKPKRICLECGKDITEDKCMNCGYVNNSESNIGQNQNNNVNQPNYNKVPIFGSLGGIGIVIIVAIYFISTEVSKISGCYVSDGLKLCVNGENVTISSNKTSVSYYAKHVSDSFYIRDKYGKEYGYCQRVKNSKNIVCDYGGISSEFIKQ